MTSNLRKLVLMIPDDMWVDILANNMISNAKAIATDQWMIKLSKIYNVYLDSNLSISCDPCRTRVLNTFKQIQGIAIQNLKEKRLLDAESDIL